MAVLTLFHRLRGAISVALGVWLLVLPRAAFACPVCFGEADAPLTMAMNTGILVMLGVVAVVWCAFALFFLRLWHRARAIRESEPELMSRC